MTKKKLTAKVKREREIFCHNMLRRVDDLGFIVFCDETSAWLNASRPSYAWQDMDIEEDEVNYMNERLHGPKVHVWAAISLEGKSRLEIFEENMNVELYTKILKKHCKEIKNLYPEGLFWYQDNDPKHKSKKAMEFINKTFMANIEAPSYSPDLNPIEMIWVWLKHRVRLDAAKDIKELKASIRKHWNSINADFLRPYIEQLERRWQWVADNNGIFYSR